MVKQSYVTIFPELTSVHLKKDVGMLPYSMSKYCFYKSKILCYKKSTPINSEDIKKYNITFIKKRWGVIIDFGMYLLFHSRKISVLNLYHITSRRNFFWIIIYRLTNRNGKVHLKLDADRRILSDFEMYPKKLKQKIKNKIIIKYSSLVTVESKELQTELSNIWGTDIKLLPNGFYDEDNVSMLEFDVRNKEDFFLTVGRLGTEQKATEVLLEAYAIIANEVDYKLFLIGSIEANFIDYIDNFFLKYSQLKQRVIFLGEINDMSILSSYYMKCKVFVMPSRYESFGLVLLESLKYGPHFILSDQIPVFNEVTKNGSFGDKFCVDDTIDLAKKMKKATKCTFSNERAHEANEWAYENFSWEKISKTLKEYLEDLK